MYTSHSCNYITYTHTHTHACMQMHMFTHTRHDHHNIRHPIVFNSHSARFDREQNERGSQRKMKQGIQTLLTDKFIQILKLNRQNDCSRKREAGNLNPVERQNEKNAESKE